MINVYQFRIDLVKKFANQSSSILWDKFSRLSKIQKTFKTSKDFQNFKRLSKLQKTFMF